MPRPARRPSNGGPPRDGSSTGGVGLRLPKRARAAKLSLLPFLGFRIYIRFFPELLENYEQIKFILFEVNSAQIRFD